MNAMIQHGRVGLVVFYAAMVTCFSFLCQLKAAAERSGGEMDKKQIIFEAETSQL